MLQERPVQTRFKQLKQKRGTSGIKLSVKTRSINFNSIPNIAIKDYIMSCNSCSEIGIGVDNFSIIRKCESDYHRKFTKSC